MIIEHLYPSPLKKKSGEVNFILPENKFLATPHIPVFVKCDLKQMTKRIQKYKHRDKLHSQKLIFRTKFLKINEKSLHIGSVDLMRVFAEIA